MKVRALILTSALVFAGAAVSFAQSPMDGTWKLNEAKSHIPAGAIKSDTVTYESQGDNVKVTTDGTVAGTPTHTEWTGKFDGKDYPMTGSSMDDTRAYTQVNAHTLSITMKKAGKVTTTGRVVVSADGKTRTVTLHSTDPSGKKVSETAVYDKQ
ncbi:MAG TPA: hypothetical protein VGU25_17655 [Acidobacteriaceae bacterium]|nr:hypothetical protein [Acidobacteriaceae bacterium]